MNFRTLKPEEIDVKVGNVTAKGYTLLLYKNARVDMVILDETVGVENWQRDHKEVKGNLFCGIGINVNYEDLTKEPRWIWKWDCGVESAFGDKEKGESSDSFKRSGFCFGIGRELYTSPFIFVPCETEKQDKAYKIVDPAERYRKFKVEDIEYNENREIAKLKVVDTDGCVVFNNFTKEPNKVAKSKPEHKEVIVGKNYIFNGGKYQGKTIAEVMEVDMGYLDFALKSEKVSQTIKDNILEAIR